MKKTFLLFLALLFAAAISTAQATIRSSASFSISSETLDGGGQAASSASFSLQASSVGLGAAGSSTSASYSAQHGFIVVEIVAALIEGRWVFYNRSAWDGNDPAANANDDNAIATNKSALLPGGTATFTNYTSYSRGLNGLMVDISNLPGTPTASDFAFKVGNDNTPAGWSAAPAPVSVTTRALGGGVTRLTLLWNDNNLNATADANEAVAKQWLQVTVLATANTGLPAPDVFYFGNAVGEGNVDNPGTRFRVTAADALQALNNLIGLGTAGLANANDHDRDQKVKSADALLALNNLSALSALLKLDLSPGGESLVADTAGVSTTASAPPGPFLEVSRPSPRNMRVWLWEPQQTNPALVMTEDLASGKWRPIPSGWLKPLGGGLFEVNVPMDSGSAFLRLDSTGTGALDP